MRNELFQPFQDMQPVFELEIKTVKEFRRRKCELMDDFNDRIFITIICVCYKWPLGNGVFTTFDRFVLLSL